MLAILNINTYTYNKGTLNKKKSASCDPTFPTPYETYHVQPITVCFTNLAEHWPIMLLVVLPQSIWPASRLWVQIPIGTKVIMTLTDQDFKYRRSSVCTTTSCMQIKEPSCMVQFCTWGCCHQPLQPQPCSSMLYAGKRLAVVEEWL